MEPYDAGARPQPPESEPELATGHEAERSPEMAAESPSTELLASELAGSGASDGAAWNDAIAVQQGSGAGLPAGDAQALSVPPGDTNAPRPTFLFLGVVASISLALDIVSKGWAEIAINRRGHDSIELVEDHLSFSLAYNEGGAWGLLSNQPEYIRLPFFVMVSLAAIVFIVSLYGRLHREQKALTWGLPLVLGGALGNLSDRITRTKVVDFIDYRADWVLSLNSFVHKYVPSWTITDHWPTFNVADIAICIGVGLMAVDMFTSRRMRDARAPRSGIAEPRVLPAASSSP